jgi:arylsulfatase A-like enzyme
LAFAFALTSITSAATKPNILYILCDDLGYGDVSSLNPDRGKIKTPHIDQLASAGMIFTDAHSSSSVCTPTRYDLLTGRYNWRSRLQKGVLQGDSKPLIAPDRMTVATLLRQNGYTTAAIGKWHLGLSMNPQNWAEAIKDGPLQHGFDTYFGISASLDMPPFAFIDGDHFPELPTATKKWIRSGPAAPSFEAVDVLPTLTHQAIEFLKAPHEKPFFLYVAFTSPHTPIVPSPEWSGKSGLSPYGDFVMQTDAAVGEILDALHNGKLDQQTLVLFTSDNGCSPAAKPVELEAKGHFPSANFRGYKSDIWDGGHRIPFIARWPGVAKAGSKSDQTICLGDLMATCAAILDVKLPDTAGEDSVSILPALQGTDADKPLREAIIHHSMDGRFAIRQGNWKLCLCSGSGGWSTPREAAARKQNLPPVQLYDLSTDIAESKNVAADHPEIVEQLRALLNRYITEGRSTPGAAQKNDVEIDLDKPPAAAAQADRAE